MTPRRKILAYVAAAAIASTPLAIYSHTTLFARADTKSLPEIVFWAWERPEDLRFLNPQHSGVAFLAKTIELPSRNANPVQVPCAA